MNKKIICLFGPTASGKTELAIRLTQQFPFDIISVDSAMVYRGMDIGTAKPTPEQLSLAPHRLIDICDPAEHYSAGQFCLDARREIDAIFLQGKIPLLVGGTMLYFQLLQRGFDRFPCADAAIRADIDRQAKQSSWPTMHAELMQHDPITARQLHPNDSQRIQRALEIFYITGKTVSALQQQQQWLELPFDIINLVVVPQDRAILHQRIAARFDAMLADGLLQEAENLYQRGDLDPSMPAMRMLGYRQLWQHFSGKDSLSEARERAIIATRQFAKRQFTWLNQWPDAKRFNSDNPCFFESINAYLSSVL